MLLLNYLLYFKRIEYTRYNLDALNRALNLVKYYNKRKFVLLNLFQLSTS